MHEGGDVVVDEIGHDCATGDSLEQAIRSTEADWRLELAYEPPTLHLPAAIWATTVMYRAAQCLVYREIDATTLAKLLKQPCPAAPAPDVCYSADLALRALPGLFSLSRGVAV